MKGDGDETDWKVNKIEGKKNVELEVGRGRVGKSKGKQGQESKEDTLYFIHAATLADAHPE